MLYIGASHTKRHRLTDERALQEDLGVLEMNCGGDGAVSAYAPVSLLSSLSSQAASSLNNKLIFHCHCFSAHLSSKGHWAPLGSFSIINSSWAHLRGWVMMPGASVKVTGYSREGRRTGQPDSLSCVCANCLNVYTSVQALFHIINTCAP